MIKNVILRSLLEYATSIGLDCTLHDNGAEFEPFGLYLNQTNWYIITMTENQNYYWSQAHKYDSMELFDLKDPNCIELLKRVIDGYK